MFSNIGACAGFLVANSMTLDMQLDLAWIVCSLGFVGYYAEAHRAHERLSDTAYNLACSTTLALAAASTAAAVDITGTQVVAFRDVFTSCMGVWACYEVVRGVYESQRAARVRKANDAEVDFPHTFS